MSDKKDAEYTHKKFKKAVAEALVNDEIKKQQEVIKASTQCSNSQSEEISLLLRPEWSPKFSTATAKTVVKSPKAEKSFNNFLQNETQNAENNLNFKIGEDRMQREIQLKDIYKPKFQGQCQKNLKSDFCTNSVLVSAQDVSCRSSNLEISDTQILASNKTFASQKSLKPSNFHIFDQHITNLIEKNQEIFETNPLNHIKYRRQSGSNPVQVEVIDDKQKRLFKDSVEVINKKSSMVKSPVIMSLPNTKKFSAEKLSNLTLSNSEQYNVMNSSILKTNKCKDSVKMVNSSNCLSIYQSTPPLKKQKITSHATLPNLLCYQNSGENLVDDRNLSCLEFKNVSANLYGGKVQLENVCSQRSYKINSTQGNISSFDPDCSSKNLNKFKYETSAMPVVTIAKCGLNSGGRVQLNVSYESACSQGQAEERYCDAKLAHKNNFTSNCLMPTTKVSENNNVEMPIIKINTKLDSSKGVIKSVVTSHSTVISFGIKDSPYVPGIPGPFSQANEYLSSPNLSTESSSLVADNNIINVGLSCMPTSLKSAYSTNSPGSNSEESTDVFLSTIRPNSLKFNSSLATNMNNSSLIGSTLLSPDTPRPRKASAQLLLDGSAYTYLNLKVSTKTFYCCIHRPQPMYVLQSTNKKLSMYSNWQICKTEHPLNISPPEAMNLYVSGNLYDAAYTVAKKTSSELYLINSTSSWKNLNENKKLANHTSSCSISHSSERKNFLENISFENLELKIENDTTQKKMKVLDGSYKSDENYTYVRGRGKGSYVCELCGIRCKKPSMLKKHIQTHTNLRPFACQHCSYRFKTKGNLTKHMKSKSHHRKCSKNSVDTTATYQDGCWSSSPTEELESEDDESIDYLDDYENTPGKICHVSKADFTIVSNNESCSSSHNLTISNEISRVNDEKLVENSQSEMSVCDSNAVSFSPLDMSKNVSSSPEIDVEHFSPSSIENNDSYPIDLSVKRPSVIISNILPDQEVLNKGLSLPTKTEVFGPYFNSTEPYLRKEDRISKDHTKCLFKNLKDDVREKIDWSVPENNENFIGTNNVQNLTVSNVPKFSSSETVGSSIDAISTTFAQTIAIKVPLPCNMIQSIASDTSVIPQAVSTSIAAIIHQTKLKDFKNSASIPKALKGSHFNSETLPCPPANLTVVKNVEGNSKPTFIAPSGILPANSNIKEGKSKCKICQKEFSKQGQLRVHINIHFMERAHKCESCSISFRTAGHLQKHKRSVSHFNKVNMNQTFGTPSTDNPRPFKCHDCTVAFRIYGHLAKHLRSKLHIMKLECLNKLPFGTYAEIERTGINLNEIDTSDCENSLDSLQILASKLYENDPLKITAWKNSQLKESNNCDRIQGTRSPDDFLFIDEQCVDGTHENKAPESDCDENSVDQNALSCTEAENEPSLLNNSSNENIDDSNASGDHSLKISCDPSPKLSRDLNPNLLHDHNLNISHNSLNITHDHNLNISHNSLNISHDHDLNISRDHNLNISNVHNSSVSHSLKTSYDVNSHNSQIL